jgi:hypothetical protein
MPPEPPAPTNIVMTRIPPVFELQPTEREAAQAWMAQYLKKGFR